MNSHRFRLYRAFSIFGQFVKSYRIFLELNSKRQYQSSGKENESLCLTFPSSTKRKIRHFHVAVVQWRRINVQKSVLHQLSFCFANLLIFLPFLLPSSLSLLKPPPFLGFGIWTVRILAKTKKHCKFKSIQLLMKPSPTTPLPKEPNQSGFEKIQSVKPYQPFHETNLPLILDSVGKLKCF